LVLMESILSLSDELPESVQNDFYDFFVYRDAELFKNVFENLLKSSKFVNREKLEEIGLRYELF